MTDGYTKLFASITDSTIWQEPDATRLVWITMLAMADQNGYVGASVPGLAARARVSLDACVAALQTFRDPDPWSRSADYEGRRIVDTDGGWLLLNHAKYRAVRDAEARREQARLSMARLRAERKAAATVNDVSHGCPPLAQAEAEAEATKSKTKADASPAKRGHRLPPDWEPSPSDIEFAVGERVNWRRELEAFRDFWGAKSGKDACKLDWSATWRNWIRKAPRQSVKPAEPAKSQTRSSIESIGRMIYGNVDEARGRSGARQAIDAEAAGVPRLGHDRDDPGHLD